MADTDLGLIIQNLFKSFSSTGIRIVIGVFVLFVVLGILYYFIYYRKRYDILVKVISERAKDPSVYFDKAAIITERKTGKKYFRLLKTKCELAIPPFKILTSTNKGDYLEIWRKSEDEFIFLTYPTYDKIEYIGLDGKVYPTSRLIHKNIESDINFIIERKTKNKKLINPESVLMKLLEYAPQIISSMFIIIILYIFLDKLPIILDSLNSLLTKTDQLINALNQTQQVNIIE